MHSPVMRSFSLISALLWAGATLALAVSLTYHVERQMLREASLASLDYFRALTRALPADAELRRFRQERDLRRLEVALAPLLNERKVVTIKLYDASGRLLYHSRAPGQVGQVFLPNPNLQKALAGESALLLSDLSLPEHFAERGLGVEHLLELYLPIRDGAAGPVIGAYEIYASVAPFFLRLGRVRAIVWGVVLAGAFVLYAGLFVHFRRASRTILGQTREIEEKARNLEEALAGLRSAQAELVRSERLATVGQLAAGVAHEVGNPLGSIMGMTELLLRCQGHPGEKARCEEYLRRLRSEVMRLKGTIRGLLDYARPAEAKLGALDLNALVEKTVPLFRMQKLCRSMGVRLELSHPPPCAVADEALMQQILLNLLLNAGQAMGGEGSLTVRTLPGDPGGRVDLRFGPLAKGEPAVCVVEVRDTGPGIPPQLLPRIFEPFVSTRPPGEGAGLGLAVCLRLVEELKGAVEVESRVGEGSSFRVFLPTAKAARRSPGFEGALVG